MRNHPLIGFDKKTSNHRLSLWLNKIAPDANYAASSNSVLRLVSAAEAGVGVAALPTALGNSEPDLVKVLGAVDELTRAWRLLAHRDARHLPAIEAFFKFVESEVDALKPVLTG